MKQELLYKYFKGESSIEEEMELLNWLDESEENRTIFSNERLVYDLSIFADTTDYRFSRKRSHLMTVLRWTASIAALFLIILGSSLFFNNYFSDKEIALQTVQVPMGQRVKILLADGSRVWLNSKSTLTYGVSFGKKERVVNLDGEAYFEVAKNKKVPFLVKTQNNQVKVVGTTFNVCAYKGTNEFEISLIEGVVDVFEKDSDNPIARLTKRQTLIKKNDCYQKGELLSTDFSKWRDGLYCFDDLPFSAILKKLELYYDTQIIVTNPTVLNYRCTGKFKDSDGIEHVLKVIQKDHPFDYSIDKERTKIVID